MVALLEGPNSLLCASSWEWREISSIPYSCSSVSHLLLWRRAQTVSSIPQEDRQTFLSSSVSPVMGAAVGRSY